MNTKKHYQTQYNIWKNGNLSSEINTKTVQLSERFYAFIGYVKRRNRLNLPEFQRQYDTI